MPELSRQYTLVRRYQKVIDKLPCRFFYQEAIKAGIEKGDLQRLKLRGILKRVRLSDKEYIWEKVGCSE